MELRDAGITDTRRDGRYIFIRLTQPALVDYLIAICKLFDISTNELEKLVNSDTLPA
jgi:hypothetical protein